MPKRRQKKLKVGVETDKKTDKTDNIEKITDKDEQDIEKEKLFLMRVGVSCLMVIFFVFWILNLRHEFKISLHKSAKSGFDLSQTKNELAKAMDQVKQSLAEVKEIQGKLKPAASLEASESALTPQQIDSLKEKLLDEVASSIATGTASSTVKN